MVCVCVDGDCTVPLGGPSDLHHACLNMQVEVEALRIPSLYSLFERHIGEIECFKAATLSTAVLNFISYIMTVSPMQEHVTNQKIIKALEEQKQMEEDDRIKAHFKAKETIAKQVKKKEDEMRR